ncbi:TonB-dependent receptor [Novosphingobium umbonatum]|uniref:TonB-dependent receptor n=1 Tax=Novosphingobium umbonatum TaxID=1908524 RepID=A0A437N0C0_9SPHN|nr:TonB-dependent receptor [Novosphingobium umbonatum]RVU03349.1 TonB-dependent receptor [Novosphingobium umbonatum]
MACISSRLASVLLTGAAAVVVATPAWAADGPSGGDAIIVTGTRQVARSATQSLAPIDVLSAKDLQTSGKQSVRDLLGTLLPSINVSNAGSGASFAVKALALRGLSTDHVLVLVNGKRRHNTATLFINGATVSGQSPADLDLIPSTSISRIEVLRDGASAQYGSDAIAGVVNVIMKDDLGGGASFLGGATKDGGGQTGRFSIDKGFAIGGARLHLSAESWVQARTARSAPNPGQFYARVGQLYSATTGTLDPREATVDRNVNKAGQPASEGFNLGYDFSVPVGSVKFYSFGTMSHRHNDAYLTFRFPDASNNIPEIYPNGYSPHLNVSDRDYQVTAGVKSQSGAAVNFDLSSSYSTNMVSYVETTALNASMGPASPTTFYIGRVKNTEWTNNLDLQKEVGLGLYQPLSVAVGGEFRQSTYGIEAGEAASYIDGGYKSTSGVNAGVLRTSGSQGVTGFAPSMAGSWKRKAWSAYVNLEQKILPGVELALAGRHEDYSDFGKTDTGKVSTRLEPVKGLALRGTASTGFRAPTLQQQHYSSASTINVSGALLPVSALPVDSAAAIALGAKPLKPERSVNYSVGFVFTAIPRFSLTVDAYQIKVKDRILLSSTLQGTLVRSVLAAAGITSSAGGFYFGNSTDTRTRGLDIVGTYRADLGQLGSANLSLSANFNETVFTRVDSVPSVLAGAGLVLIGRDRQGDFTRGTPRNKFIANVAWEKDRANVNLRATRYGSVTQVNASAAGPDATVQPKVIVDLDVGYKITDKIKFSLGANNLFNIYPDKLPVSLQGSGFSQYNPYSPYGVSGGFYYGRINYTF